MRFEDFREATWKFHCGELGVKEYKGVSGRFGSYAQKGGERHMLRLRMTGGSIDKKGLKFIVECIDRYKIDLVHMTTCQSLQFHNLDKDEVCEIMESAFEHGISTFGGGGDFPRNVTASPLSGVEIGEFFDVLPYAKATERYLMPLIGDMVLPRKLKIGFSNSSNNEVHATFRDLGFLARSDGNFDVYSAGGLGNNPRMGLLVAESVSPSEILYHVKAMVDLFKEHGNYENRAKARTRYMQDSLGEEGYKTAYRGKLKVALLEGGLDVQIKDISEHKKANGQVLSNPRVHAQKQDGLYYVSYHPIGGDPDPSKFKEIYETIKDMSDVELRISPDQTMFIINCNSEEVLKVQRATDDGARDLFETSIACIGSSICQQGLRDSNALLHKLVEMSRRNNFADGALPRVQISGCNSSCAAHQIGTIGFQGTSAKSISGESIPAFNIFVNGSHVAGNERFGQQLGKMAQDDIPSFLEYIGKAVTNQNMDFRSWCVSHNDDFLDIVERFLIKD
jgi:sulfite reductase (ferredoxin)